jgi:hypothetical protein
MRWGRPGAACGWVPAPARPGHVHLARPRRPRVREAVPGALAKAANPKRGLSEAQLLELLQDTFAQYTAIAGAATVQPEASLAFRSWRAYLAWACDPTLNVKELLAGEGLQLQS